jgi:hypothetical protein
MVALAGVIVVLAFPDVVFGGRTFTTSWQTVGVNGFSPPAPNVKVPRDDIHLDAGASAWQFEPWAEVTARAYRSGEPPLWNPYQGMGAPLAANFQSAAFDPLLAPVNLHPTTLTWDLAYLLAFFVGAAGTYLFLRTVGLGRLSGLVGVAVFIFSGFFFLLSNNQFFRAYMYLPVLLLLARLTVRSPRALPVAGLGLAVAGSVLVGMPEAFVLVLGALTAYSGFAIFTEVTGARARFGAVARLAMAATLGALLAAPLLLPALAYIPASYSTHEGVHQVGLFTAAPGQLLNWVMPYVLGRPVGATPDLSSGVRDWIGVASCVAVLGAVAAPRPMRRHGGWFFLTFGLLCVLKAYGFPLMKWTGRLPALDKINFPIFAMPVIAFAAAVVVAIGVQALMDGEVHRRRFGALFAVFAGGVALLLRMGHDQLGNSSAAYLSKWFGVAAIAATLAAAAFLLGGRLGRIALAGAILGELLLLAPRGYQAARYDPYTRPQWLQYVARETAETHERVFGLDAKLFPNVASAYGIADLRTLDALYPERYVTFVKTFVQPGFYDRYAAGPYASVEETPGRITDNPMFDLTGVRFVITGGSDPTSSLITRFFQTHPATEAVKASNFNIAGDMRTVLLVKPSNRVRLNVPAGAQKLSFSIAPDPAGPSLTRPTAIVTTADASPPTTLWRTSLSPGWQDVTVPLTAGITAVDLVADSPDRNAAAVGFAGLRFGVGADQPGPQYREVTSSDGARVFENSRRFPRVFVVHNVSVVNDEAQALQTLRTFSVPHPDGGFQVEGLDLRSTAIVEDPEGKLERPTTCNGASDASIQSLHVTRVVLSVTTPCPGLVVLTDTYDKGWKAVVNGRSKPVLPTDLAFRGVAVDAGQSTIELLYRPRSFQAGVRAAMAAPVLFLTWPLIRFIRRRRNSPGPASTKGAEAPSGSELGSAG